VINTYHLENQAVVKQERIERFKNQINQLFVYNY